ncbi:MAG: glycerol-3-phosphate 1-O-acyltransferase PlsY [Chloroflexota bacterium]|nr:glycerol-3-phosphate 1-O-acyltransferase PlsY [Chloroflexota bacterium]
MNFILVLFLSLICFLVGSLQTGTMISKIFYKVDVRELGSKNSGATNVHRTIGLKPGIIVLILDILKGFIPILFLKLFFDEDIYGILGCIFLVLGHCYPLYHRFNGGKGVATGFGSVIVLVPYVFLGLFIAIPIIYKTRFVSLGSIIGCLVSIILILILVLSGMLSFEYLFLISIPIMIIYKHKTNIVRLLNKQENKLF